MYDHVIRLFFSGRGKTIVLIETACNIINILESN